MKFHKELCNESIIFSIVLLSMTMKDFLLDDLGEVMVFVWHGSWQGSSRI